MEVSRLANRLMASRTGANGVDIDGRHQFIDYPLWQASRFESCSDSHARARCRRRADADRRFAQDRLGRRRSRRRGYFLSGDGGQVCGSGNSSARSGRARVAAAGWLMLWPGRSRRVAIGSHRRLLAVALGLETTDMERPQTRYAKSGDVNVAYQVIGDGPFDLIFAPGFVSNLEYGWEAPSLDHFYRRLASFCRLVIFDKRGTGLSDRVAGLPDLRSDMERPQTRYAKSGDVNVAYQVIGDGPFDLIFAPGFVSNLEYGWEAPSLDHFYRRLASFCRLVIFDKRGTGLSDRVAGLPDLETRMDDVRAIMDAINAKRAAVLGYSEGAAMAALFAATYPDRTPAPVMSGSYLARE